jgi:hypothetical protein
MHSIEGRRESVGEAAGGTGEHDVAPGTTHTEQRGDIDRRRQRTRWIRHRGGCIVVRMSHPRHAVHDRIVAPTDGTGDEARPYVAIVDTLGQQDAVLSALVREGTAELLGDLDEHPAYRRTRVDRIATPA